jgi:hypothetical protein
LQPLALNQIKCNCVLNISCAACNISYLNSVNVVGGNIYI